MNNKTINWKEEFNKLFPETTERTKSENDEWCPKCDGIGFKREGKYIRFCNNCNGTGIIKACKCGNKITRSYKTICDECEDKEQEERFRKQELERFEKAEKINFEEYDGKFVWNEKAIDPSELEEELYIILENKEDVPNYIYATEKEQVFGYIDLKDVVYNECENGYEDMETYLDYGENFDKAQEYLNKWVDEQGETLSMYSEDFSRVVLLDDIIAEIKQQLKNEN